MAGGSTFTLSLPIDWGNQHGLSKGDSLYLYPDLDRLIIAPSTIDDKSNTTRIDVAGATDEAIVQRIKAAYTAGCERIVITDESVLEDDLARMVTDTVENFIGMRVQTVTDNEVVIQDHLNPNAVSIPQSISRIRQIAIGMQRDAVKAVRTDDETLAQIVYERDNDVDRLFAFVSRCLHRGLEDVNEIGRLSVTRKNAFHYYKIARELERVADKAERIADVAVAQSTRPDDELGKEFQELVDTATEVVIFALNDDSDGAIESHRKVAELLDVVDSQLANRPNPDAYRYGRDLVESARRTSSCGLNIVNMTVEVSVMNRLRPEAAQNYESSQPIARFGRGTN